MDGAPESGRGSDEHPAHCGLLTAGVTGSALAAICCFTPFLPWILGVVGLTGLTGYLYRDAVLLPMLAVFLVITGVALWLRRRAK